jgi:thioredoxin 1
MTRRPGRPKANRLAGLRAGCLEQSKETTNMASANVVEFTDGNFQSQVLSAPTDMPVLVDFWAEWCMPCKMLTPTIEAIADEFKGRVRVGKVDTDSNRDTAVKYAISAIPTVIIFKNGQVAKKFVGLQSKNDFVAAIDAILSGATTSTGQ